MYGNNTEPVANRILEEVTEADGTIVQKYKPGDYVVCNLSSINLGRAVPDGVLERLIQIQVRMLDNVIDINTLPLKQTQLTNRKYRAIGLGTFGWHHLLAKITCIGSPTRRLIMRTDFMKQSLTYPSKRAWS